MTHQRFGLNNKVMLYGRYLVWGNDLIINCEESLDLNKVSVVFENELPILYHTRPEEAERLSNKLQDSKMIKLSIFQKGVQTNDIPYAYGKQRLIVSYDNIQVGELSHWKTNYYHVHSYVIEVALIEEKIRLSGKILGQDELINCCLNY
jgi:hypothetical protein